MTLPRALALVSVLVVAGVSEAIAQATPFPPPPGQAQSQSSPFPPPPGQAPSQSSPFPPTPGQTSTAPAQSSPWPGSPGQAARPSGPSSPFPQPGAPLGGRSVCDSFPPIREQAEKGALAIRAAGERKAPREELCSLFTKFAAAESRMMKFLETNQTVCGVPADAVKQGKAQHAKTQQIRKNVCSAGPGPQGPSLSDALGGPALPDAAPKPGRGTFDTLTGSPLAR